MFPLKFNGDLTERVDVAVMHLTHIRELLDSNLGRDTGYHDEGFP
jgi:hypothetical protein